MKSEVEIYQKVADGSMTLKEAIAFLERQGPSKAADLQSGKPSRREREIFPLSQAQKALWFIHRLDPDNYASNSPAAFWLGEDVDLDRLRDAFQFLHERLPCLRTIFPEIEDKPMQQVLPGGEVRFDRVNVSDLSERELKDQMTLWIRSPFDLERGPLMRVTVFTATGKRPILLMVFHHIIFDGGSFAKLVNELARVYAALIVGAAPDLEPLTHFYSDFVAWQETMLASDEGRRHWAYWREKLAGELPILSLPQDYARPPLRSLAGSVHAFELGKTLIGPLTRLARAERCTLFAVLLAAYKVLLFKYTETDDLIVGLPVSGRPETRFENVIGYFVNMVGLRSRLSDRIGFLELLQQIQQSLAESMDHGDFPFSTLVERLGISRDESRTPIFQVAFIFQNWIQDLDPDVLVYDDANQSERHGHGRLVLTPNDWVHETGGFDLSLDIFDAQGKTMAFFKYNPDLFSEKRIANMAEHFRNLLDRLTRKPKACLSELSILSEQEKHRILVKFNRPKSAFPRDKSIHHLIGDQCRRTPDAVAVTFENRQLTYAALRARARQLARYLETQGVTPEAPVALCVVRSLEMVIGILGILEAGGCYAPIDPAYPAERLNYILEDTRTPVVLTLKDQRDKIPGRFPKVSLDADWRIIAREDKAVRTDPIPSGSLAYVIYTSGSTGKPKGVLISHKSLVNYTSAFIEHYQVQPRDRALQFASISFDTAAEELFPTLTSGANLIIRSEETTLSIHAFTGYLAARRITILDLPTAYWHEWVMTMGRREIVLPVGLRLVIVGGESASAERLAVWREKAGDHILWSNTYGPTETTIAATLYEPSRTSKSSDSTDPVG